MQKQHNETSTTILFQIIYPVVFYLDKLMGGVRIDYFSA